MSPQQTKSRRKLFALSGVLAVTLVGLGVAFAVGPDGAGFSNGGEADADGSNAPPSRYYFIRWGDTNLVGSLDAGFAFDECRSPYSPIPAWALAGYRWFGRWGSFACDNPPTNVPAWLVDGRETNASSLNLDLDRAALNQALDADKRQALFLGLSFVDYSGQAPSLRVSLLSTNGTPVLASDKNLIEGNGQAVAVILQIPVTDYPEATCIHIAATAPATVFETLLYIDTAKNNAKHIKEIGRWSVSDQIFDPGNGGGNTNRPGPNPWPTPAPTNTPPVPTPTPTPAPTPAPSYETVYISQAQGSDVYNGYSSVVQVAAKSGPKRSVRSGTDAIRPETRKLIISAGDYRGDKSIDLRGQPVNLVIDGNVKL